MTEFEKCMAGEIYDCHHEFFLKLKSRTRELLTQYHQVSYEDYSKKQDILVQMLGNIGSDTSIAQPFLCDYGKNIYLGNHVSTYMNCTFIDCNRITIGDHVLIAPNVQLYTATHPVELSKRFTPLKQTFTLPITIKDGCWLGGGVIVLPGVTIGYGSVIGAGSVVTKNIPDYCVAAGNPCTVIRRLSPFPSADTDHIPDW